MEKEYLNKWWFWFFWCLIFIFACVWSGLVIVSTQDYHFYFYANEELLNVTKYAVDNIKDINFNDCISSCYDKVDCAFSCIEYYHGVGCKEIK